MRSTLLVTLAFIVLVLAFFLYQKLISKPVAQGSESSKSDVRAPILDNGHKWGGLSSGKGSWYEIYTDEKNSRLKSKFRAAEYLPQENGEIAVKEPEAWFYMPNGQKMRLIGVDGEVVMPESSAKTTGTQTQILGGAPSRGQIHTVTIELFNMYPDSKPDVPDETMTTDNIDFDNITMLITTKQYVNSAGKVITGDEAPVHMRSKAPTRGYDMDGRGLQLRWNDKDGRLDLLEIDHGEWLMIKDTSSNSGVLGGSGHAAKTSASQPAVPVAHVTATPALLPQGAGQPGLTAAATAAPLPGAPATTAPPRQEPRAAPFPYVATFYDNVRITQGPDVLITADRMDVDFISRQAPQSATTAPTATANTGGKPALAPVPDPQSPEVQTAATQPAPQQSAEHHIAATRPVETTAPATQPSAAPVLIYWTGRLHMEPANGRRPTVTPGDAIVELNGMPVTVRRTTPGQQDGDDIRAARVVYHTLDGAVKLSNSQSVQQVLIRKLVNGQIDPRQTITTETLDYTGTGGARVATLSGVGHALLPVESTGAKPGSATKPANPPTGAGTNAMMDAHWKKGAKVYFTSKGQGAKEGGKAAQAGQDQLDVEHIDLSGDVDVKHPQLVMNSQALSLYFAPPFKPAPRAGAAPDRSVAGLSPTTRPADASAGLGAAAGGKPQQELKKVVATDNVHCELAGQNGKKQIIDCNELVMHTARSDDGKFYAKTVNTRGHVHATDGEQDLYAGGVDMTLKPARPDEKKTHEPARKGSPPETSAPATAVPQTQPAQQQTDTAAVDLERMIATDNVRAVNKDGSVVMGSELIITTEQNEQHVLVVGSGGFSMQSLDFGNAVVIDSKMNMLSGPIISIEPKSGIAHVVGPGAMHVSQEQTNDARQRPMVVAWVDGADMNGPSDRIDVFGNVAIQTRDADGTNNHVTGDHVQIDLMKKAAPATRPSTQPAASSTARAGAVTTTQPSTRPAKKGQAPDSMQMDVMKDKDVRAITIESAAPRQAKVISILPGPDGKDLRQFLLIAPRIIYQLVDAKDQPAKTLIVPSAGQMLVGDHRPPEKPRDDKSKSGDDASSGRGTTAFRWGRSLIYTEQRREAVMTSDVYVRHRPDSRDSSEIEIRHADQVNAWFEPQKPKAKPAAANPAAAPAAVAPAAVSTAGAATKPATRPADSETAMQLTRLIADGNVAITRAGSNLFANQVDYDPITHWMIARGSTNHPAHYEDPDPKKSMTAGQMEWNTESWHIKMSDPKASHPR